MITSPLWGITSYYNPQGYKSRLLNFRRFRDDLGIPLIVVELSATGLFELWSSDADLYIPVTSTSVMWQKERLLNIALSRVPERVEYVAWIDCDILFHCHRWIRSVPQALQSKAFVQLFNTARFLPQNKSKLPILEENLTTVPSYMSESLSGKLAFFEQGRAWAGRKSLLQQHGLYDAMIVGGGDILTTAAMLGGDDFEKYREFLGFNKQQMLHYEAWAKPFHQAVVKAGGVGCLNETLYHLWHGEVSDRSYDTRHKQLIKYDFDPFKDVVKNYNEAWEWATNKPALHEHLTTYFRNRQEDGPHNMTI